MSRWHRVATPGAAAVLAIALAFGPLLIGIEPVGGDPERLYRPVKTELARALKEGRLPWWSDRFGVGVPLAAESHAAAFYPLNWVLYSLLPVHPAYRLAMWAHHVLMAAGVFVYARRLGTTPWGAALAAVSFPLCGFQAVHASHEVFYHALAWLPWALVFADRYAGGGRPGDLAALALVLGLQWTVGHFQMQTWTAILVLASGAWAAHGSGRWVWRSMGLLRGVVWGTLIAAVQLVPSWELARFVGQASRPAADRMFYWFPPAHLGEPATPTLFRAIEPMADYWFGLGTSGYEACFYVGTIPLMLAFVGLLAGGRKGAAHRQRSVLTLWKLLVPLALVLATMPGWWPRGYAYFLSVPILGAYRAPARYTAIASLGLCLLAGAGLDRLIARWRFAVGLVLATAGVLAALAWSIRWVPLPGGPFRGIPSIPHAAVHLLLAAGACAVAVALIVLWRAGRLPAGVLVVVSAVELAALYYTGPIRWGWALPLPQGSPVLNYLASDPEVLRVGGRLENYPVLAGKATATPYLGFLLPDPNPMIQRHVKSPPASFSGTGIPVPVWYGTRVGRFVVSHFAEAGPGPPSPEAAVVWRGRDPVLSRLVNRPPSQAWYIAKLPQPALAARVAIRARDLGDSDAEGVFFEITTVPIPVDEVVMLGRTSELWPEPHARSARLLRWDGHSGEVEHDGSCLLVVTRTFYPGWTYRLDGGPAQPVIPVDGGLQGIPIPGAGTTRVTVAYRPTGIGAAAAMSLAGLGAVGAAWALSYRAARRAGRDEAPPITPDRTTGSAP